MHNHAVHVVELAVVARDPDGRHSHLASRAWQDSAQDWPLLVESVDACAPQCAAYWHRPRSRAHVIHSLWFLADTKQNNNQDKGSFCAHIRYLSSCTSHTPCAPHLPYSLPISPPPSLHQHGVRQIAVVVAEQPTRVCPSLRVVSRAIGDDAASSTAVREACQIAMQCVWRG